ncbi:protein NYNRIN-like [Papaver somniferum]|uniref:protein NYNRIN-like n=1 Tax=Papaver somniferum TaxID=3469 RepID=UPI000E6F5DBE|nr:protein NYNRIN-like [Papaver somniferum]
MEDDAVVFVQRCQKCQIHGNLIHVPSTPLHSISSPWPFYSWGLDIIGKINPPSSKHYEYIITITEYFTKWVESIPLRGTAGATIAAFIKDHIICRFGVPKHIITDKTFLSSTSYQTVHDNPRTWHEQLPMALWAYRTSPRISTGASPYSLVYDADVVLPTEVKIPSARITEAGRV